MTAMDPWGIDKTYEDAAGKVQRVSEQTIDLIRTAMGRPPAQAGSLFEEPVLVMGQDESIPLPRPAELRLEEGSILRLGDRLPVHLPIGYHWLMPLDGSFRPVRLIISPKQCHLPSSLRVWGWSAQLYATRSHQSWGMGDLADLRRLSLLR